MTTSPERYSHLFASFSVAREAYIRLEARGARMSDAELARDSDYHTLFRAGLKIVQVGGREALEGAIDGFFPRDAQRTQKARANLGHWWAGFGTWHVAAEGQGRMN